MATSVLATLTRNLQVLGRLFSATSIQITGASDITIERTIAASATFSPNNGTFSIAKALLIYFATDNADITITFASGSGATTKTVTKGNPWLWDATTGGTCPVANDCTGISIENNGSQAVDSDVHGLVILDA